MPHQAAQSDMPDRRGLAAMVLTHRVLPRDPLAAAQEVIADTLLRDPGATGDT